MDSTNIIRPELSVITNISFDHTQFLGDSLDKIAFEKAGIIKKETPVVIGESLAETKPVFIQKAESESATVFFAEELQPVRFLRYENGKMIVKTADFEMLEIGLNGIYQLKNVATVLEVVKQLQKTGFNISEQHIRDGLSNVVSLTGLLGRWQTVSENPKIILDTAHNKGGFEYITEQLQQTKYNKLHFVFGMVNDKDISGVLSMLPKDTEYYFTAAETKRALSPEELKNQAKTFGLHGNTYNTVYEAVKTAMMRAGADDLIYIGGSNFVVGEALELF